MAREKDKAVRRFTMREFLVYVLLLCVVLGVVGALDFASEQYLGPVIEILLGTVGFATICLLGALIGVAIIVLSLGRRRVLGGAVVGAVALPVLLYVAVAIVVFNTHR